MNKKFIGALLLGGLIMAGGTFTGCSDYDDDINSLNERVDAVEKAVADLKAAIEAGSVITDVTSTENGVTVTLSDGKTFELTNGQDGADDTPGSVVAIGDNGNWFIDGVDTGKPSRGEKGEQGEQGPAGPQGPQGEQGPAGPAGGDGAAANAVYYKPGESGYWVKVTVDANGTETEEETTEKWAPEYPMVRVVYDSANGVLLISNAEGMNEGEVVSIALTSTLKSLAVIPYALDKETNYPLVFFYNIMGYTADFTDGNAAVDLSVATSTNAKAHYRVNPANANVQDWTWSMIDRVVTRAEGDKDELLSVIGTEKVNDELIVTLKSNQSLEDLREGTYFNGDSFKEHAIAALQGTNKETAEVITSDYVKVTSKDLKDFSIITGYDAASGEVFELMKAGEEDFNKTKFESRQPDMKMVYNGSLDLSTLVKTYAKELKGMLNTPTNVPVMVDDMVNEGELTYEFTLPAEYLKGANKTNQQDFVTLDGSVLKVNSAKYPNGRSTIGTTPIVWVRAIVNGKTIASGVMKIIITDEEAVEKPAYVVTVDPVEMEYSDIVRNEIVKQFTWEDMRQVYDALNMTRDEFIEHYNGSYEVTNEDDEVAFSGVIDGVSLYNWSDQAVSTTTNAIEMYFIPDQIASDAKGTIKITYTPDDVYTYAPVVIEFPYAITHTHQFFPEFNPLYVENEVATIKGDMVNGEWTQIVEISEHFKGLDNYVPEGNHNYPHLEIEPDAQRIVRLNLTGTTLGNQVLTLESPIIGAYVDVPVRVVETLANGEDICVKTYTIRFVNPFAMTIDDVKLEAPFPGRADAEGVNLTIKAVEGGETIATIKGDGNKMVITVTPNNKYGIQNGDITLSDIALSEGENWAELAGLNNDYTQKLSLDENTGSIKWENKGSALTTTLNTTYKAQVRVKDFCIMLADGKVSVSETGNPIE